jgi:hypothetical protein
MLRLTPCTNTMKFTIYKISGLIYSASQVDNSHRHGSIQPIRPP